MYIGYIIGSKFSVLEGKVAKLLARDKEPDGGVSNPLPPNYTHLGQKSDSAIVTPKSPDQVERENEEELRRLNGL